MAASRKLKSTFRCDQNVTDDNSSLNEFAGGAGCSSNMLAAGDCDVDEQMLQLDGKNVEVGNSSADSVRDFNWSDIDEQEVSSESSSEDELLQATLADDLIGWANGFRVCQNALDALLRILIKHGHNSLPRCARTLLQSKRRVDTSTKSGMEYYYLGVKHKLSEVLAQYAEPQLQHITEVSLSFNIDGIPMYKSACNSLWPILCGVTIHPFNIINSDIFPVALCYGRTKPSDLNFLSDTIEELKSLMENGLTFSNQLVRVSVSSIVCDAPAKALVKATKLFSGYYGCDKCEQKGEWHGRMTYPECKLKPRTDQSFREQRNEEHHNNGYSPFCDLPIDMINDFPVDYMHQGCLGVMKRLLLLWMRGDKKFRLAGFQVAMINDRLTELRNATPNCFQRKPRTLKEIEFWKATEYRLFLVYYGQLVLRDILNDDCYKHFMCLVVAMRILLSPSLVMQHLDYARQLLTYFVSNAKTIYGVEFMVYNVHSLLHFADEAAKYGSLDRCSAFCFENYLQRLKKHVRTGSRPIAQIVKRLDEVNKAKSDMKVKSKMYELNNVYPNNVFIMDNNCCCEVLTLKHPETGSTSEMLCRVFKNVKPAFDYPCESSLVGCFKVPDRNSSVQFVNKTKLMCKAILIKNKTESSNIFLSLLHDINN